jgi:hypothetical protein
MMDPHGRAAAEACRRLASRSTGPTTVVDFVRLLGELSWITPDTVSAIKHVKGEIPVEWNPGETVLAIRLPSGAGAPLMYLRFSGPVSVDDFLRMVDTGGTGNALAGVDVLEAACA